MALCEIADAKTQEQLGDTMKLYDAKNPTDITEVQSLSEARDLLKSVATFGDNALYVVEDGTSYHLFVVKNSWVVGFKQYERLLHARGILLQMKVLVPFVLHLLVLRFFGASMPDALGYVLAALATLLTVYLVIRVVGGYDRSNTSLGFWLNLYETRQRLEAKGLAPVR